MRFGVESLVLGVWGLGLEHDGTIRTVCVVIPTKEGPKLRPDVSVRSLGPD